MVAHLVRVFRYQLQGHGWFPRTWWEPRVTELLEVKIEPGVPAREVIEFAKEQFPLVPRHEIVLDGFPEQAEWPNFDMSGV